MNIAFVLSREQDSVPLWELIAPVRTTGDRVEFWFPGPVPESSYSTLVPAWSPDLVIYGLTEGECANAEGAGTWDLRYHEGRLRWLEGLFAERRPSLILFPASLTSHELGVRLAARLNCGCFPETRLLFRKGSRLFARKKVCGSNLNWDAEIIDLPAVLTVTGGKTSRIDSQIDAGEKRPFPAESPRLPPWILDYEQSEAFPANPLETAPLIFVAGRGLGSKFACDRLRRAAGRFGAPLSFSRPAALNGWGEIAEIIGQSGLHCGAELCIAVGVSGAAAFITGIESVPTLIAVNPDRNAPIFRYADIGIVAGAEKFISVLEAEMEKG